MGFPRNRTAFPDATVEHHEALPSERRLAGETPAHPFAPCRAPLTQTTLAKRARVRSFNAVKKTND